MAVLAFVPLVVGAVEAATAAAEVGAAAAEVGSAAGSAAEVGAGASAPEAAAAAAPEVAAAAPEAAAVAPPPVAPPAAAPAPTVTNPAAGRAIKSVKYTGSAMAKGAAKAALHVGGLVATQVVVGSIVKAIERPEEEAKEAHRARDHALPEAMKEMSM